MPLKGIIEREIKTRERSIESLREACEERIEMNRRADAEIFTLQEEIARLKTDQELLGY